MRANVLRSGPLPEEYVDLQLCRMFGCRPSELDEEDEYTLEVYRHLAEQEYLINNPMPIGRAREWKAERQAEKDTQEDDDAS